MKKRSVVDMENNFNHFKNYVMSFSFQEIIIATVEN